MKHKLQVLLTLVALLFLVSCEKPTTNKPDEPITGNSESVAQEVTKEYTGSDTDFDFSNGVKIILKGSENSTANKGNVAIKLMKDENYFNTKNDIVLDFSALKSGYAFNFEYNLKPNLVKEDLNLLLYSPERSKGKLAAKEVKFDYDKSTGKLTAKFTISGKNSSGKYPALQSDDDYSRLVISWADRERLAEGDELVTLQMPYYEQPGGTC